jgi:TRAP transporter TAXI family solute receptor
MERWIVCLRLLAVALAAALFLSGCDRGPKPEQLKADLEHDLAINTPPGLLTVAALDVLDANRLLLPGQRRLHFTAHLRVMRDHSFGGWDQFNVTALADALDAATDSIDGVKAAGNQSGDILTIPGRAVYAHDKEGWHLVRLEAATEAVPLPPQPVWRRAWRVIDAALHQADVRHIVSEDLQAALRRAEARIARLSGGFAIVSGPVGSDEWKFAEALRLAQGPDRWAINMRSRDARDSLRLLRDGGVTAAIIDSDVALTAQSTGAFGDPPLPNLRVVANLYPEPVQVIVRDDSKLASVADLRGKRVAIASGAMGVDRVAEDVLRAHRLPTAQPAATPPMETAEALAALAHGDVAAVVIVAAAPAAVLVPEAEHTRILGLDSDAIALLTSGETRYLPVIIPPHTYPRQILPVATVAVTAMIVSTLAVPPDEVATLLQAVFGPVDYARLGSAAGALVSRATAERDLPLPLHPGAEAFYKGDVKAAAE